MLPYLEVCKDNEDEMNVKTVEMPNITGMEIEDAKKVLKELNLEWEIIGEGLTVYEQLPKKGIQINEGTKVIIDTGGKI